MSDTSPIDETVVTTAPSNEPSTPATPVVNAGTADVEAAKREAEQARMRANQLENELKKIREDQEATKQKQLEEQNEFKTLYEQTQARLKEIEDSQKETERSQLLNSETVTVFSEYPDNVVELAKTAGLSLTDDSDAAKASLKEKLDAFKTQMGSPKVAANNPANPSSAVTPEARATALAEARAKGGVVHKEVLTEYLRELPAIKRMKEIARNGG